MKELVLAFTAVATAGQPIGMTTCPDLRPGARITIDSQGPCTTNFLFEGNDGNRYIGTAGHCVVDDGTVVFKRGTGPEVADAAGSRIGEVAYASLDTPQDFALVRIDRGVDSAPGVCHFGGPVGTFRGESKVPVVLHHYGHGIAVGYAPGAERATVPARTAVATNILDDDTIGADGAAAPGDSGSPVIDDEGRAVGVLTELGGEGLPHPIGIRRIGPAVALAERWTGLRFRLLTARY